VRAHWEGGRRRHRLLHELRITESALDYMGGKDVMLLGRTGKLCYNGIANWLRCASDYTDEPI